MNTFLCCGHAMKQCLLWSLELKCHHTTVQLEYKNNKQLLSVVFIALLLQWIALYFKCLCLDLYFKSWLEKMF